MDYTPTSNELYRMIANLGKGKTPPRPGQLRYQEFLKTPEWRGLREAILERDQDRCRIPGCGAVATEVHHRTYQFGWLPHPRYWHLLWSVCSRHHRQLHGR